MLILSYRVIKYQQCNTCLFVVTVEAVYPEAKFIFLTLTKINFQGKILYLNISIQTVVYNYKELPNQTHIPFTCQHTWPVTKADSDLFNQKYNHNHNCERQRINNKENIKMAPTC